MRLLFLALLLPLSVHAAAPRARVLVVSFQSLGVDPETMNRVGDTLRTELSAQQWVAVDGAETQRVLRAATMCGEDLECLATLGQRADARWVLAWGFGKVGASYLFTSLLVETTTGTKRASFNEKLPSVSDDSGALARRAVTALFQGVSRVADEKPFEPPPPPPSLVAERRLVAPTLVSGGVGVAGALVAGVFGVLAATNYGRLQNALVVDRPGLVGQQRTWNLVADVGLGAAILGGAAALVLFILGAPETTR
jgi:hypothetical protein